MTEVGGVIGGIIVLLILSLGVTYLVKDLARRFNNSNRYSVCIKDGIKDCGLPLIKFKINGKNEWFLLDSGCNSNCLRKSYYDKMEEKAESVGNKTVHDANGSNSASTVKLNLARGKSTFQSQFFDVVDLATFNEPLYGKYNIVGVVGSPFFNENKWILDFEELVVWIKKS